MSCDEFDEIQEIYQNLLAIVGELEEKIEHHHRFSFFNHRIPKGELMSEVDDLTTQLAVLGSALTVFDADYTTLKANYEAALAAGSASVPLTVLDPFIASVDSFIAQVGSADPNTVPAPPVVGTA